jgi:nucleotide-binding universal stress UspA family protein
VTGNTPSEIVRVAKEIGCDLIVMGTHGRTGLGRVFMGSVAEEILKKAPCAVLTLKTPM